MPMRSAGLFRKTLRAGPGKKAEKGYVLLRETLVETRKIGIAPRGDSHARIPVRGDPEGDALMLILLRYPQELVDGRRLRHSGGKAVGAPVSKRGVDMARQLIDAMATNGNRRVSR